MAMGRLVMLTFLLITDFLLRMVPRGDSGPWKSIED